MGETDMLEGAMPGMVAEADGGSPRAAALAGLTPEYRKKLAEARRVVIDNLAVRVNVAAASPTPFVERLVHSGPTISASCSPSRCRGS